MRIGRLFTSLFLFSIIVLPSRSESFLRSPQDRPSFLQGHSPKDLYSDQFRSNERQSEQAHQDPQSCSGIQFVDLVEGGISRTVAISGNIAFTNFSYLFLVLDVSNPAQPERLTYLEFMQTIEDVELYGNYAYVTMEGGTIKIIDITDPANPFVAGSTTVGSEADEMIVDGGYGYVLEGYSGVRILDLTDPLNPTSVTVIPVVSGAHDIVIRNNYAYLAESGEGLRILDVSDPTSPTELGRYARGDYTVGVAVSENYAYTVSIMSGSGLCVIDIQDPSNPFEVAFYNNKNQWDVLIDGNHAYMLGNDGDLSVMDVSDPANPVRVGFVNLDNEGLELVRSNSVLYTANWGSGFYAVNVVDPTNPTVLSNYSSVGGVGGAVGDGAYLYFRTNYTLSVFDRHFRKTVSIISPALSPSIIYDMELQGSYAYLATSDSWYFHYGGLVIVDLSDPFDAAVVGRFPTDYTGGRYKRVTVWQDRVYAIETYPSSQARIFDVSDPASPTQLGTYSLSQSVSGLDADTDYLYLATDVGLRIVQVSDPLNPAEVGSYDFGSGARDVVVSGSYAFVGGDDPGTGVGFRVIDVADRSNPTEVANHITNGLVQCVVLSDNHAYLSGPQLIVLNVSDPLNPDEVAQCDTWQLAPQVAVIPPFIYGGKPHGGHLIILNTDMASAVSSTVPNSLRLDQNYPNPFNPFTTITFVVPVSTHVTLSIYDVEGKLVVTLVDGVLSDGPKSIHWDGRDSYGKLARSGVYFYRLTAGDKLLSKKMILIR